MKTLIKNAREQKGLKTREVAQILGIDQALISKFESGTRRPTREQVLKIASLLEIDVESLMIFWLKEKIVHEIGNEEFALQALKVVEEEIRFNRNSSVKNISAILQKLLDEVDVLKAKLNTFPKNENSFFKLGFELEYTHSSNWLEGNSLTLAETDLIINEGQTISGKSMREHLEAINHQEAIAFIKNMIQKNIVLSEKELISLHSIILRGILPKEAGQYRKVPITLKDNSFNPAEPTTISKEMEALFDWHELNKNSLHPIILAATIKERFLIIQPFINGNGKVSRLLMNFILLQHGYLVANIETDDNKRIQYYQTLKASLANKNKEDFKLFIAQTEKKSMERYLEVIGQ